MEKINGIIVNGKIYEAVECNKKSPCDICDLQRECSLSDYNVEFLCSYVIGDDNIFRYSPELTDKLKGE